MLNRFMAIVLVDTTNTDNRNVGGLTNSLQSIQTSDISIILGAKEVGEEGEGNTL